jgi:hypothetical protein
MSPRRSSGRSRGAMPDHAQPTSLPAEADSNAMP